MDVLEKYKLDSIVAQLKLDLPNRTDEERAKYIDLVEIMLESHMLEELEVNGGKQNFNYFIDTYADKLLSWKSQND